MSSWFQHLKFHEVKGGTKPRTLEPMSSTRFQHLKFHEVKGGKDQVAGRRACDTVSALKVSRSQRRKGIATTMDADTGAFQHLKFHEAKDNDATFSNL